MYFYPGVALIWGAFAFGLAAVWGWIQAMRGDESALNYARKTYFCMVICVVGASALLMTKLLTHDYTLGYVFSYSSSDLPLHYLISTFWAGQEGSFLLWLFWGAIIGIPLYMSAREQEAPTMIVYTATILALVAILMKQSPFKFLDASEVASDGKGLNPLLQDPWMVIHPPIMFLGFASLGVPFAFAVAGLWKRRYDSWIVRSLPWALLSFVTLGTAILMGGYWAYKTLGWGGYWGWDPVENTSLVPWIAVTALVHGMFVQRKKGRYRRLNFALAIVAYICILYGTFLTRSGILADFSVHSFVDLGITGWLVSFLMSFLLLGCGMLAYRFREIPSEEVREPFLSRGVFLLLAISALLASGFVIMLGTSAPLITRLGDNPSQVTNNFYNVTTSPLSLLILLMVACLPYVDWKGTTGKALVRQAAGPMVFGVLAGIAAFALGVRHGLYTPMVAVGFFGFASSLVRYSRNVRGGAFSKGSGYLAHAGISLMIVGIVISSAFDRSQKVTLPRNVATTVHGYSLTFLQELTLPDGKNGMEVRVAEPSSGKSFLAYPKFYVNTRTKQLMANPHVEHKPFYDFYVSPQEYDPGQPGSSGTELAMKKGETKTIGGVRITFDHFVVDPKQMMADPQHATVGIAMKAASGDGEEEFLLRYSVALQGGPDAEHSIPRAPAGSTIRVESLSASAGMVKLRVDGPVEFAGATAATPERVSVDVTIKPMINLVWFGLYLMVGGGLLALINRTRASLAAAALPADPEPVPMDAPEGASLTTPAEA